MKLIKYSISLLMLFFLVSCASTRMTSFKDPDYQNTKFKRILIVANTSDLEERQELESKMVEAFTEDGVFALESYKLFPPTRELTDKEKVELLLKNNIDAFISISVGENGVSEVYIPQTSSTTKTEGDVNVYGNTARYNEKSTTMYQGGYKVNKPWAEFQTELYDVSNGRMVWIASSFTGGNAYANKNTVINSYCEETVNELLQDKLIIKNAEAYYNRDVAKDELGDYQGAIQDYNEAIEINPKYAEAYYNRGVAKYNFGDNNGACLDWSKAGELGYSQAYDAIKKFCK